MADGKGDGEVSKEAVLAALSQIEDPDLRRDIVSLGFVKDEEINVSGGSVSVRIVLTTPACPVREKMKAQAEELLLALPGIDRAEGKMAAEGRSTTMRGQQPVEGVRNVIAVASNKGGVGKSTVAVNLALALTRFGARVGLMDADLTGPNLPTMLWRGPMVGTGVRQLLHDMPWGADGELDYLVVDLPPGTSDASLSMAQEAPIAGTVIVTTPNSVSLEDAMKAVMMFEKLNVPVFGVIGNMSYFACPHCGGRTEIFGHGGAREAAEELGLDFLGEIPLDVRVREGGDSGVPVMVSDPDSPVSQAITEIAQKVAAKTSVQHFFAQPAAATGEGPL